MRYRVEVPGPTSARYVKRSLDLLLQSTWGGDRSRPLDASPGVLEFECATPHIGEMGGRIDADFFTVELVEQNGTGSRRLSHCLTPIRLED